MADEKKTANYSLTKANGSTMVADYPGIQAANMDAIDAQMKANADSAASKQDKLTAAQLSAANSGITAGKVKRLDGMADGANNYSLPKASASVLGGIKVGSNLSISSDGTLSSTPTGITVDSELSTQSTNPVQNRIVSLELSGKLGTSAFNSKMNGIASGDITSEAGLPDGVHLFKAHGLCILCLDGYVDANMTDYWSTSKIATLAEKYRPSDASAKGVALQDNSGARALLYVDADGSAYLSSRSGTLPDGTHAWNGEVVYAAPNMN